jgi:hypothetical protein
VSDYHEVDPGRFFLPKNQKLKCVELGCFYPNFGWANHSLYFGLYYTGKRPARTEVLKRLRQIAFINDRSSIERDINMEDINWGVTT